MQCPNQENLDLAKQFESTISIGSPSTELLLKLIKESLSIKSSIIQIDEFDNDIRKVFNFGHTFGHAIEAATKNYVPHGIAVLFGINIALEMAETTITSLLDTIIGQKFHQNIQDIAYVILTLKYTRIHSQETRKIQLRSILPLSCLTIIQNTLS